MSAAAAIYLIGGPDEMGPHVDVALARLAAVAARLVIVGDGATLARIVPPPGVVMLVAGDDFAAGIGAVSQLRGPVIMTGAHAFAPIVDLADHVARAGRMAPGGVLAAYCECDLPDLGDMPRPDTPWLPSLDLLVFDGALLARPGFARIWRGRDHRAIQRRLAGFITAQDLTLAYALDPGSLPGPAPAWLMPDRAIAAGAPCLPAGLLALDPLMHDLCALDFGAALREMQARVPDLAAAVSAHAQRCLPPRALNTITDAYAVLPDTGPPIAADPGVVAVLMHVFYPAMMAELYPLIARIPVPCDLFISVPDAAACAEVAAFLRAQGNRRATIRIVAQNRGRDMSALFITFADVALCGRYEVALRLHSKRTPHIMPQVAAGFRQHLFENLAASPAYISQILARFAGDPQLGLVMPPAVQIGFGALGHGWYANKAPLAALARELGIAVPLDDHTPVAPYGTMFWFRPAALRKLFAHPWRWHDYNAEPNHIDGGLAHVQERLIGYAVQDAGYHVLQVMTPGQAARNYARLEYKFQLFAGQLASASVAEQFRQISAHGQSWRLRPYQWAEAKYAAMISRYPRLRPMLRPLARQVARLLVPRLAR